MRRRILIIAALVLLVPVAAVCILIYTPLGVSLVSGQLHRLERYGILIEGLSGTFSGPLSVRRFELEHPRVHVLAHDIAIDAQMRGLLLQTIRTRSFSARDVEVQMRDADMPPTDRPARFLPPFLRIDAHGARLERVRYVHVDGRRIEARQITGRVTVTSNRLRVREFDVDAERFDARGDLRLIAARPLGIELETEGNMQLQPDLNVVLSAALDGTADRMGIHANIREPSNITIEGLYTRELDDWRITGKVASPAFSLQPWLDAPPFSFSEIALDVEVEREQIHALGQFTIPEYELEQVGVDARGRFADRVLHVQPSKFTLPGTPGQLTSTGTLTFEGGPPKLDLTAQWTDLQWPLRDTAVVHSASGEATLQGRLPYDFGVRATIDGPNLPAATGSATGLLRKDGLSIANYEVLLLGGRTTGSGTLEFAKPRPWVLAANAQNLDARSLHAQLPGSLSFGAHASGAGLDKNADFKVAVADLRGTLRGERLRGSGSIQRQGKHWRVHEARVSLADAVLALDANLRDSIEASWTLTAPSLHRLLSDAEGAVEFQGTASGKAATPHISATLRGEKLRYEQWSAQRLAIDGDVDASNAQASRLSIVGKQLGYGTRLIESLHANGDGTALAHRIGVEVVGADENTAAAPRAKMEVLGKYEQKTWTAAIATTQFSRGDPPQQIKIEEPANVVLSRDHATLKNFCLVVGSGRICAAGDWQRNGEWEGTLSGYDIPLAMALPATEEELEYAGRIEGSARAFGGPSRPWQGEAGMKISDAAIIYRPRGGEPETLNLGTGGMHLVALPERVDFSFGVQAFTDTYLHTNARLIRNGSNDLMNLPLSADIRARAADANLLPLIFPEVDHAAGLLTATGRIGGTLNRPELSGRIELSDGEVDSYRVNFALRDLDLVAGIDGNRLNFRGTGDAGEGKLQVDGDFSWTNGASNGRMHLRGDELLVADLPEYRVVASPDLRFEIDDQRVRVKGDVAIPSANIQPARLAGAVGPSADARFVGEHAAEKEGRVSVQSDVNVQMGKDVRVDAFGLHARIEGAVATAVRTGARTTGHGELRVAEGRYEAYGQELPITRGQLLFDNAPLEDPGLDIEARRRVEASTTGTYVREVGLNVRGTLQQPRLTFFSDPSLPQTQILSYLLVGKSLDNSPDDSTAPAGSQSNSLALQGGGFLASQLGRRIGIEAVGVENYVTSAGEANPSLVLGKFLSPRLFISYGISLTESINTLKLRYTISDRWIFRTESGEAQSADLEYMLER
jgi:translocation and assembly module TamB